MRGIVSGLFLLELLCGLLTYFYGMATGCFGTQATTKQFYMISMALYMCYVMSQKCQDYYENNFTQIGICTIIVFFVVGILNNFGILGNEPYTLMKWFIGLLIAVTTIVLISGMRHGIFKN